MGLEDKYLDVLQNIEFSIVSVYRDYEDLNDYEVMRALDALIEVFRAESRGHTPREVHLPEKKERLVFERVKDMCELRMGRATVESEDGEEVTLGDSKTPEEILGCLRKIRKSVERWTQRGGKQGYLEFVSEFLP